MLCFPCVFPGEDRDSHGEREQAGLFTCTSHTPGALYPVSRVLNTFWGGKCDGKIS